MCKPAMHRKLIAVTNRKLCSGDFLEQLALLCENGVDRIVLREKDLNEEAYEQLAEKVIGICRQYKAECILHTYPAVAARLAADGIHLPLAVADRAAPRERQPILGISVHSTEDAIRAEQLGADYVTAGHVFATSCKAGLAGRGLEFLSEVVSSVSIPVYAIGGITAENIPSVLATGAAGVCIMSHFMTAESKEVQSICMQIHGTCE